MLEHVNHGNVVLRSLPTSCGIVKYFSDIRQNDVGMLRSLLRHVGRREVERERGGSGKEGSTETAACMVGVEVTLLFAMVGSIILWHPQTARRHMKKT